MRAGLFSCRSLPLFADVVGRAPIRAPLHNLLHLIEHVVVEGPASRHGSPHQAGMARDDALRPLPPLSCPTLMRVMPSRWRGMPSMAVVAMQAAARALWPNVGLEPAWAALSP